MNMSLILKLRLVLKIPPSEVCTNLSLTEMYLKDIELEQCIAPKYLIEYYANHLSMNPSYLKMLFRKNNNYFYQIIINCIDRYFDLILLLRKAGEKK